jgi:hypothetical protein
MCNDNLNPIAQMMQAFERKPIGFVLVVDEQQQRIIDYRIMDVDAVFDLLNDNGLLHTSDDNEDIKL